MTFDELQDHKRYLKIGPIIKDSNLNEGTIRSAIHYGREVRPDEAQKLLETLTDLHQDLTQLRHHLAMAMTEPQDE